MSTTAQPIWWPSPFKSVSGLLALNLLVVKTSGSWRYRILTNSRNVSVITKSLMNSLVLQRWCSWTAFLVEVSGHKLECLVSRIFCKDFKNQSRVWFSLKSACRRDCEQNGAKDSSLLLNWCPRIPPLGPFKHRLFQHFPSTNCNIGIA
jgi:hypothetical protein